MVTEADFPGMPINVAWFPNQRIDGRPVFGPKGQDIYPEAVPDPENRGPYLIGSRPVAPRRDFGPCWWCGRTDHHHRHCSTQFQTFKWTQERRRYVANNRAWYRNWLQRKHQQREALWAELRAQRESRRQLSEEAAATLAAAEADAEAEQAQEDLGAGQNDEDEWEDPAALDDDEEPFAEI